MGCDTILTAAVVVEAFAFSMKVKLVDLCTLEVQIGWGVQNRWDGDNKRAHTYTRVLAVRLTPCHQPEPPRTNAHMDTATKCVNVW